MMKNRTYTILFFVIGIFGGFSQNQPSKDTLDTQKVIVIKPYTPSLSDAFKLKMWPDQPNFESEKLPIDYNIFSVPVASTFSPAKSKSVGLTQWLNSKSYNNIGTLSIGNYTTISGNLSLNYSLSKQKSIGINLSHNSSQGGIHEIFLNHSFSTNLGTFTFQSTNQNSNLDLKAGFKRMRSNWYGISNDFPEDFLPNTNVKQTVSVFETSGTYQIFNSWFNNVQIRLHALKDRFDSSEFNFITDSNLNFNLFDVPFRASIGLDVLSGTFIKDYDSTDAINNDNFIVSFFPSYEFNQSNFKIKAGLGAYFFSSKYPSKHNIYVVPDLTIDYDVVSQIFVTYAGIQGNLSQNTYLNLFEQNPFISPTLALQPTFSPIDIFIGVKGKFTNQIGFDLKGQYRKQTNFLMFQKHIQPTLFNDLVYTYGNSFGILYDNVNTLSLLGSLEGYFSDKFQFNSQLRLNSFTTKSETEVWNLPELEAEIDFNWKPTSKWNFRAQLFYVGKRKEYLKFEPSPLYSEQNQVVSIEDFIDLNFTVEHHINNRWLAQLKLNNILGQNYQLWHQYQALGFQISAGAYYKFDL